MLNHFKQKIAKLVAPGKVRSDTRQVRCLLERLEDRMMLSTSPGMLNYDHSGPDFDPRVVGSRPYGDSVAVASQQGSVSHDSQMNQRSGARGPGGANYEFQSYSSMQPASKTNASPPRPLSEPDWNESVAAPPSGYYSQSVYFFYMVPASSGTYYYFADSPPKFSALSAPKFSALTALKGSQPPPTDWQMDDDAPPPPSMSAKAAPVPVQTGFANNGPPRSYNTNNPSEPVGSTGLPHPSTPSPSSNPSSGASQIFNRLLANNSTTSDLSQSLSHESGTVAAITAVAHDAALQEFTSKLFQPNATVAYDRVNVDTPAIDSMQPEIADGLIGPTDKSMTDEVADASDVVVRERAAVDALLNKLGDINTLLPRTIPQDGNVEISLETDTALDGMPAGEVDGGMVLLRATGDANTSGFDLTPMYAEHVARFNMPAKMETSVGMFQAMDVALDDAPIIETVQNPETPSQLKRDSKLEDNIPIKHEQSSTNKAAVVVGAATLTGALVWINRNGSRVVQPKPTAQKRRASCS